MAWLDNQVFEVIRSHRTDNEVVGIIVPGVEVDESPGERLHRYVQARAVFVISPVPTARAFALPYDVTANGSAPFQNILVGLELCVTRWDTRRKPRRTRHWLAVLLEVGNIQEVERVSAKEISDISHPRRNAAILEVTGFKLHRFTPVHRVDDIDELPIHLAPSNLLFPQHHIKIVRPVAEVQFAHDTLEVVIVSHRLAAAGRK